MSILVDEKTKVLIQGISGTQARYHSSLMLKYKTNIVAGVSPNYAGTFINGIPVYYSVYEAMRVEKSDLSILFLGPKLVKDAAMEAIEAGVKTIVILAENVPIHDTLLIKRKAVSEGVIVIGPNSNGIMSPGKAKVGFFASEIVKKGPVGIASKSGSLAHGAVLQLQEHNIGQSTIVGIGGDQIKGLSFVESIQLFEKDPETECILLLGEIGGKQEELVAEYVLKNGLNKPIVSYLAGRTAPKGTRMGHAGAIIYGEKGSWESKKAAFDQANITVAQTLGEIPFIINNILK